MSMNLPDQRIAAERLAELTVSGSKPIKDAMAGLTEGGEAKTSAVSKAVNNAAAPLLASLQAVPGGTAEFESYRSTIELLALDYALGGSSAPEAASRAFNDVIGKKYRFRDTLRIPAQYDDGLVARGVANVLRRIGDYDLSIPQALAPGLTREAIRESVVASLQSFGTWYAAPDESGAILYGPDRRAVTLANGELLIVPWDELQEMAHTDGPRGAASQWFLP